MNPGSYGVFSASSSFTDNLNKVLKDKKVNVLEYASGGSGQAVPTTYEAMLDKATNFPQIVSGAQARVVSVTTLPYDTLFLPPGATVVDYKAQKEIMILISNQMNYALQNVNDISFVLAHQGEFKRSDSDPSNLNFDDIARLVTALNSWSTNYNIAKRAGDDCLNDVTKCSSPTLEGAEVPSFPRKATAESCHNPIYVSRADPLCGVALYNAARQAPCPVESYKEGTLQVCGAATYNERSDALCGVSQYNEDPGAQCGIDSQKEFFGLPPNMTPEQMCKSNGYDVFNGSFRLPPNQTVYNCTRWKTCRDSSFGATTYNTCALPHFGVKTYKTCRDPSFGVDTYQECRLEQFGVEAYNTCAKPEFGFLRCGDPG